MKKITQPFIVLTLITLPLTTLTAQTNTIDVSTGTGFYISNQHILTNAHVLKNCQTIYIEGDRNTKHVPYQHQVTLIGTDTKKDLALLKTSLKPPYIGIFRSNDGLKKGDKVMVIGFPKEHARTKEYHVEKGHIIRTYSDDRNNTFLELTDAVEPGNSGGPLLDPSGRIIGVVVGENHYFPAGQTYNKKQITHRTGVAISLKDVKTFLNRHRISYYRNTTYGNMADSYIERQARMMIVSITCIKNDTP